MILLSLFILVLSSCGTLIIKNRVACFINSEIYLGSTCVNTVGISQTTQLDMNQTLDMLEARKDHPPAIYQSASDYNEETIELESGCLILGKRCSYELKNIIENRKLIYKASQK